MTQATICGHCGLELCEGYKVLYDAYREKYYCGLNCYREWYLESSERLLREYFVRNVSTVDL